MNHRIVQGIGLIPVALLFILATATTVWAAGPATLELQAPKQANLGDKVAVTALLRDDKGAPIRYATVVFSTPTSFLSAGGAMEMGRATTDSQGKAVFAYDARIQGAVTLNASVADDARYVGVQGSVQLAVEGSTQLYQSTAGVRVPGLGVWLLAAILGIVWTIYLTVMVILTLIAREGSRAAQPVGGHRG